MLSFRVAEVTPVNEGLFRVCLEGGFVDSTARIVFNTSTKLNVGDMLGAAKAAPAKIETVHAKAPESKPVAKEAPEPAPAKESKFKKTY